MCVWLLLNNYFFQITLTKMTQCVSDRPIVILNQEYDYSEKNKFLV